MIRRLVTIRSGERVNPEKTPAIQPAIIQADRAAARLVSIMIAPLLAGASFHRRHASIDA
jgi:hypothetical protein